MEKIKEIFEIIKTFLVEKLDPILGGVLLFAGALVLIALLYIIGIGTIIKSFIITFVVLIILMIIFQLGVRGYFLLFK